MSANDPVRRGDAIGFARAAGAEGVAYSIERMPASLLYMAALHLAEYALDREEGSIPIEEEESWGELLDEVRRAKEAAK